MLRLGTKTILKKGQREYKTFTVSSKGKLLAVVYVTVSKRLLLPFILTFGELKEQKLCKKTKQKNPHSASGI